MKWESNRRPGHPPKIWVSGNYRIETISNHYITYHGCTRIGVTQTLDDAQQIAQQHRNGK